MSAGVTSLAEQICQEGNHNIIAIVYLINRVISCVNHVPLWGIIFTKYTKVGKEIQDDKFWTELREHCGLTVEESQKQSPEILKWYREDTKLINMSLLTQEKPPEPPRNPQTGQSLEEQTPAPNEILKMTFGKYGVNLPQDKEERNEVGEILINMINLAMGKKLNKPSQK